MSTVSTLADAICSGDRRALAQAITLVESILDEHQAQARELLTQLMGRERQALRIGITGVPGAGKSTFIEALGEKMIDRGERNEPANVPRGVAAMALAREQGA